MNGIELIAQERQEQIEKHGRDSGHDAQHNDDFQLSHAASWLVSESWGCNSVEDVIEDQCPIGWNKDIWAKMVGKTYRERLIIGGALIAAELDRLTIV